MAHTAGWEPWANDAETVGWRKPSGRQPADGRILVIHGNAGHALHRAIFGDQFQQAANLDIYLLEYPGYGHRSGAPTESTLYAAAEQAVRSSPDRPPLYLVGESLGTGVACHLAGMFPERISGVLLVAPYDSIVNVAHYHAPILPVNLVLKDRFEASKALTNYHGPVVFWIGRRDVVVPSRFGQALHDSYRGPKVLFQSPEGGHEDVFREPATWWKEVVEFWRKSATR